MPKVNLGRIRTVFKGEWAPGTYVIDDVVLYAGSAYTCIAIAALSNNPTDTTFWVKSAGGIEFAGVWDTATTYKVNQIVTFNGATYIAITAHSSTEPTTSGQTDWITMSGGLKFEGAWNTGTTYQINDLVTFNGSAFIAISNHTGTQPEPAGNAAWAVFAGGFQFEGVWNSGIAYQTNDLVTFNGSSYIAISDHTGTQPEPAGNAAWIVFASGLQFEGAWDISTAYHVNDITILNGSSYIAISDHTGTQPEAAGNAAWVLFASGGDIADQTSNVGKVLSTDGTSTSWANVGVTELGITDGSAGDYLSTDGSGTLTFITPSSGGGTEELARILMKDKIQDASRWKLGLPTLMTGATGCVVVSCANFSCCGGNNCNWTVPSGVTEAQFQLWGGGATGHIACCCGGAPQGAHGTYMIVQKQVTAGHVYCLCAGGAAQQCCCSNHHPCDGCCSFVCSSSDSGSLVAKGGQINFTNYFQNPGAVCGGDCSLGADRSSGCRGLQPCNSCYDFCLDGAGGDGLYCGGAHKCYCCDDSINCCEGKLGWGAENSMTSYGAAIDQGMIPMRSADMCWDKNFYGYMNTSASIAADHSYCARNCVHNFTSETCWGGHCCCYGINMPGMGGYPQVMHGGGTSSGYDRGRSGQVIVTYK
jgi:hypothetical protein